MRKINILLDFKVNYRLWGHVLTRQQIQVFCIRNISKKESNFSKKTYRTLLKAPKQNCIRSLERFRQSSLLRKTPNTLFPPNSSIIVGSVIFRGEYISRTREKKAKHTKKSQVIKIVHTGLKVNDQLVAYATRFSAVRPKNYFWSHHRALKAKVQCDFSSAYSPDKYKFKHRFNTARHQIIKLHLISEWILRT